MRLSVSGKIRQRRWLIPMYFCGIFLLQGVFSLLDAAENSTAQADSTQTPLPQPYTPVDFSGVFWQSVGLIAVFSILLYIVLRVVKNAAHGKGLNGRSPAITLLGTKGIGHNKAISIVQVLDHLLVLGLSNDNVRVLLDVQEDELNESSKKMLHENRQVPDQRFKDMVRGLMNR